MGEHMTGRLDPRRLSRRQFIGTAAVFGVGGAAFLAGCGSDKGSSSEGSTATTGGGAATTGGGATTAGGAVTTAASGGAKAGLTGGGGGDGTIKIGYVTPQTGPLAAFGESDAFVLGGLRDLFKDGLMVQGKSYKIEIIDRDSESNSNTAATAAQDLIAKDGVNVMLVAQTPDTTVPVVQQATNNEIPVLSNNAPWQPHYLGIGGKLGPGIDPPVASEYNYHFFWGLEDVIQVFTDMWNDVKPGGVVGALWPDDPDGNAWSDPNVGFPPALAKAGFTLVDPGRFPLGGSDYSAQINAFKKGGVEIVTGVLPPPDFGNFWAQAQQQGLKPTAVTLGKALLFPGAVASLQNPLGLSSEIWWSDKHPTTSSLTGQTSADLARAYEEKENKQWTQPIGYVHSLFEVLTDAIVRAGGVEDKQALLDAMGETNLKTIAGTVDFTKPVVPHITKTPLVGGQWVDSAKWDVEFKIVTNTEFPEIPTDGKLQPMNA
jgi:branched-chain amino acid transport system substrate-binding protein